MKPSLALRASRALGRWPIALVAVVAMAAALLLPGLGAGGFWEPHERQLVDRIAPRDAVAKKKAEDDAKRKATEVKPTPKDPKNPNAKVEAESDDKKPDPCPKQATDGAYARSLQTRAPAFGRDVFGDTDTGRRLPIAIMGLLTVLATFGIAARVVKSPRAGILAALVILSFPLLVLQSKMITTEIGTACGGTLIIYGLISIARIRRTWISILDGLVSLVAIALGAALGFMGGGIMHGIIVPVGAVAAACGLGAPAVVLVGKYVVRGAMRLVGFVYPRFLVGRARPPIERSSEWSVGELAVGLVATIGLVVAVGILASQIYEIRPPYPGMMPPGRTILGKVVAAPACWSDALGGIYKADDDLRSIFDSSFEMIAYGTFPWGILAPIAMTGLLRSARSASQKLGAITLAWVGIAWIIEEIFSRKVGFSIWAGFPAMAVAIGGWLDSVFTARRTATTTTATDASGTGTDASTDSSGTDASGTDTDSSPTILIGIFVLLGIVVIGKDLQSFTEHLTSILVGSDQISYPTASRLLFLPTRVWIFILGAWVGISFALAMVGRRKLARRATGAMLAGTVVVAGFWSYGWYGALSVNLSSKAMFDQVAEIRKPGDQLVVMGDLGDAPFDYGGLDVEKAETRDGVVKSFDRKNRVFAIAPQTELCTLHRELGGKDYFVLDDRNTRNVLLSNKVDFATDHNPLRESILHTEPPAAAIKQRPKAKIVWDKKIELLGWDIPAKIPRGNKFEVKLYYKILDSVSGAWTTLMHFDGPARFNGDHKPINDRCPTSTWQKGDFIVDTFVVTAGGASFPKTNYELWIGFFTGTSPNFKNMAVEAPQPMKDENDRVKIMSVALD